MLNKNIKKLATVFALVGFLGSTSLVSTTEAASSHNNNRPVKVQQQVKKAPAPKPVVRRAPAPRVVSHRAPARYSRDTHSDIGNVVTGLIIGGVLGTIIANNS